MDMTSPTPPRRINPDGAARLMVILAEAFAVGAPVVPLDPRGMQLRAFGPSLDDLAIALRAELAVLDPSLADVAADPLGDHWLAHVLAEVERLAALAHSMPAVDADGTVEAPVSST